MAIVALVNLLLVCFDLSYISWRDFYLRQFPQLTIWYGAQFKGIEPHRSTEDYLEKVEQLESQVALTGLRSPQVREQLAELRTLSADIIDENPFEGAGKSGTLERIKRRMRDQVEAGSSKQAFEVFWTEDYLTRVGWQTASSFFDDRIRPLFATNYYRNIGENGDPVDRFWQIDIVFIALFALELFTRTFYLSRRYRGASWLDALVWRWYDLLLLLPGWRWLRIIPVTVRLHQARLLNLKAVNDSVVYGFVSTFAVELTEVVVLQVVDQAQELLRRGDLARWWNSLQEGRYVDLNGVNEIEAIAQHLTTVIVDQVLPQIRPEVEALMHHTLTRILDGLPLYAGLQQVPGAADLSRRITQQVVSDAAQNSYQALKSALEDKVGNELMQQLIMRFGTTFQTEVQRNQSLEEIQSLAIALLEEVKVNYVERIQQEDIERLKARTKKLYEIPQRH
jgi:hypothetical protein